MMVTILGEMLMKLVSEQFCAKILVYVLDAMAGRTTNKLDDKIVAAVAEALGVPVA